MFSTLPLKPPPQINFKRAGTKTAHVIFILDKSASMQACWQSTISGFNEFLAGQKSSDIRTFVSLYTFDGTPIKNVFHHIDVNAVELLTEATYDPTGWSTNLYDAIGQTMEKINEDLKLNKKDLRDSVTVVILTDGHENSSTRYSNEHIRSMVKSAEEKDWAFFFLGANIDAFSVGGKLGFNTANTMQYDTSKMQGAMRGATMAVNRMKSARASDVSVNMAYTTSAFTDEERQDAE